MRGRVVITDLDGPILEGRDRHYACYTEILDELQAQRLSLAKYWQLKRERTSLAEQLAQTGAGVHECEFRAEWLARIELSRMLTHDRLQPDATSKLDSWRARGITVVLATQRRNEASLREQLSKLRLLNLFDRVVVSATANKAAAVQRIMPSLNPETCVWIGDTEVDVEAARKIGCPAWVVTCGLRSETFLSALSPDRVYPDLASVEL